jgi:hypothetical protein
MAGGLLLLSMVGVAYLVPRSPRAEQAARSDGGYAAIVRHPLFVSMAPMAFVSYGGLIAVQTLWAGPWLTRVCGWTAVQAAQGLFGINLSMLFTFLTWGAVMPKLLRSGLSDKRLMRWGMPVSLLILLINIALGGRASAAAWALWCVATSFVTLTQPAVGAAFAPAQAGRALSAFNLVIFSGVFCVQWGIGLLIDALRSLGVAETDAFRCAFVAFALCATASYLWFVRTVPADHHNPP